MTKTGTISVNVQCETLNHSVNYADTGGGTVAKDFTLPAGKTGTLSTRTDDNMGVITLGAGHGLTNETVSVGWTGGKRVGMAITAYDSTTITVDGGTGDNLPTQSTSVVVGVAVPATDAVFDGDNMAFLLIKCPQRSVVNFLDSGPASLFVQEITVALGGYYWSEATGVTNPLTGNAIATINAYNLSTTATTLQLIAVTDT